LSSDLEGWAGSSGGSRAWNNRGKVNRGGDQAPPAGYHGGMLPDWGTGRRFPTGQNKRGPDADVLFEIAHPGKRRKPEKARVLWLVEAHFVFPGLYWERVTGTSAGRGGGGTSHATRGKGKEKGVPGLGFAGTLVIGVFLGTV